METLAVTFQALLYAGVVFSLGSVALRLTLAPERGDVFDQRLNWQISMGAALILVSASFLLMKFQLVIAGGDLGRALSFDFLLISVQTPVGQSNLLRISGTLAILVSLILRRQWLLTLGTVALVTSFGMEGHSLSFGPRWLSSSLVLLHVAIICWWLAVIMPLATAPRSERDRYGKAFGKQAVFALPLLIAAGLILFGLFTSWEVDLSQDYQRRMVMKLIAVAVILAIAAGNKLWLSGRPAFVWSLRAEGLVAAIVLFLTANLTSTGPDM